MTRILLLKSFLVNFEEWVLGRPLNPTSPPPKERKMLPNQATVSQQKKPLTPRRKRRIQTHLWGRKGKQQNKMIFIGTHSREKREKDLCFIPARI